MENYLDVSLHVFLLFVSIFAKAVIDTNKVELDGRNYSATPAIGQTPPGVVIHNSLTTTHNYIGSPSIVIMPDGTYIASHDYFGNLVSYTTIYNSMDRGKTWTKLSEIPVCTWATLFNRGEELYLIGIAPNSGSWYGHYVIHKSLDGGNSWTSPTDENTGKLKSGYYHCAPVPVITHNGKIWRAAENMRTAGGWGPFAALMTSVPENADLLKASNWTFSNEILYQSSFHPNTSAWLEGNAVVAPDGKVKNVLRVAYNPDNLGAICSVLDDGKTLSFNPETDFIDLPGASKKFTIRYDEKSKKYWSLVNYVLAEDRVAGDIGAIRNTQVLIHSEDLRNWTIKDTILHADDPQFYGFQYLDWQFDGEDIVAVSRTAWEDEGGLPPRQHDANFITFHRISKFRYERPSVENEVEVAKWYNNAKSAVALTFDDGFKGFYDYAFPVLEAYNIDATFYLNSSKLVNKGEPRIERYGYWEDFVEMAEAGHEMGSHSATHPDLTAIDANMLHNELANDKAMIESKIPNQKCLTYAYPFCKNNQTVRDSAANYFIAARTCGSVANNWSLQPNDWMGVNSNLLTWGSPRTLANENVLAIQTQNEIINQLINAGKFGVYCIHEVISFEKLNTTNSYEPCTTEWLDIICNFMDEKRADGDLWPTTLVNITRYSKMRDNLRVMSQYIDTDSVVYAFTDGLDDDIYNISITVNIVVPEDFKNVIIYKNDVKVETLEVENQRIQISIVPDRDVICIKNLSLQTDMRIAPAPLFRDPIFDGAADPSIIYNQKEKIWYMFYTNRRANVDCEGTSWVYGTPIGCATSSDNGRTWNYRGSINLQFEPGHNTFWAPHVIYDNGKYHLYVTYIPGIRNSWSGRGRIAHYVSKDLWNWKFKKLLDLSDNALLDATVFKKPDGNWGIWYKDSKLGATVTAVGKTLDKFIRVSGNVIDDCGHEAPLVFSFQGYYWLLTDQWEGLGVYRSKDTDNWEKTGVILGKPGTRKEDNVRASHPGVAVVGEKAFVFYFTHPGWEKEGGWGNESSKLDAAGVLPHLYKYSVIQVAELKFEDGTLTCDRDTPFDFYLP